MANPVSDFMANWLNTTYKYLKETGAPTYPKVTVGPGVMPTGAYSTVEEYPIDYGHVPRPFNPVATGIPATASSQFEAVAEEAKQNPPPTTFSKYFGLLYGDNMNACIADQRHGHNNPNALNACRDLAERGDSSGMSLTVRQKNLLGITSAEERNKPDDVQAAENEASLTDQLAKGGRGVVDGINNLLPGGGGAGAGGGADGDNGEGGFFKNIEKAGDYLKSLIPDAPGKNLDLIIMVGGGALLLVLVIAVLK